MLDKVLPLTIAVACLIMLVRLVAGGRVTARVDRAVVGLWRVLRRRTIALFRWRSARQQAARAADEAIRRARAGTGQWEGNVYKPDSFKRPRKPH